jgi:hypothetical protein
VRHVLLYCLL